MTALLDLPPPPVVPGWSMVSAAVERAGAALAEAAGGSLWSVRDSELTDLVVEAGRLAARAQGLLLRLVGEADAREVLTEQGATSTAAFLRHRLRLSPTEASSCARTARAARSLAPETGAACADGQLTGAQATTITRAVELLPVGPVRAEAERTLLEHAAIYDPVALARLARRIVAHVDPDADDAAD